MKTTIDKKIVILFIACCTAFCYTLFSLCWTVLQKSNSDPISIHIKDLETEDSQNVYLTVVKKSSSRSTSIIYNGLGDQYTLELTDGINKYWVEIDERAYNFFIEGDCYEFAITDTITTLKLK